MGTVGIPRAVMGTVVEEAGAVERVEVLANRNDGDAQKVVSEAEKRKYENTVEAKASISCYNCK